MTAPRCDDGLTAEIGPATRDADDFLIEPAASIKPAVAVYMAAHIRRAGSALGIGGRAEVGFVCSFALDTRTITKARAVSWGMHNRTIAPALAVKPGDLFAHNHVNRIHPNEQDLDVANGLAARGIGFAIVDDDVTEIYVVTEPQPAMLALDPKVRAWAWGFGRWAFTAAHDGRRRRR